ncbi:MAG: hypothetical protein A2Z20_03860, partial [Bdellovibrionales bacterium RBG_16_40_8]
AVFLKIINKKTHASEILKLEGNMWSVGRHPSCEIVIDDSAISRKHFDIIHTAEGYFVNDHGSSNRTKVNREKIEPNRPVKLNSGDIISVRHLEIVFEIRDTAFEDKLASLPQTVDDKRLSVESTNVGHFPVIYKETSAPAVLKIPHNDNLNKNNSNRKKQFAIVALVALIIYGLFLSDSKENPDLKPPDGQTTNPSIKGYDQLTEDQKKSVIDTFKLASSHFSNKKFTFCLSEIEKLHDIVPFYSDSKTLENMCREQLEIEQALLDEQKRRELREEAENKIHDTVDSCKKNVTTATTLEELNLCLQPAIELDPQNILIAELQSQVKINQEAKDNAAANQAEFARRVQVGRAIYDKATNNFNVGKLKTALDQYQSFVSGNYPSLSQEKATATRNIASITKSLEDKQNEQIERCRSSADSADPKVTIKACDAVLKEYPNSEEVIKIRSKAYMVLKRELKPMYEDSRLEESLGNIEAAKDKWMKIIEKSVPSDDYYQKAQRNLKKYGIEM